MNHAVRIIETGLRHSGDTARSSGVRTLSASFTPGGSTTHPGPFLAVNGTWTPTRQAGPFIRQRRTAVAANHNPGYEYWFGSHMFGWGANTETTDTQKIEAPRGPRILSFDLVYSITTEVMDAHVPTLSTLVNANNVALAATARPVTATLAVATQANPYVTRITVDTPFILSSNEYMVLAIRVDDTTGGGAVYDALGVSVNYDLLI